VVYKFVTDHHVVDVKRVITLSKDRWARCRRRMPSTRSRRSYNLLAVTVIADAGILSDADLAALRTAGSGSSSDEDHRVISVRADGRLRRHRFPA